jgi:hypothetical protein
MREGSQKGSTVLCTNDLAAGAGIGSFVLVTLIMRTLIERGVLSASDCAEIVDQGLLDLEQRQHTIPARDRRVWSAGRLVLAELLPKAVRAPAA